MPIVLHRKLLRTQSAGGGETTAATEEWGGGGGGNRTRDSRTHTKRVPRRRSIPLENWGKEERKSCLAWDCRRACFEYHLLAEVNHSQRINVDEQKEKRGAPSSLTEHQLSFAFHLAGLSVPKKELFVLIRSATSSSPHDRGRGPERM